jgi:hypothetical protein
VQLPFAGPTMRRATIVAVLVLVAAVPALAQPAAPPEPPAQVGRVSHVSGSLAFRQIGQTEWSAAALNYPVAEGGSFWTDAQSRAALRIGPTTIGMAEGSEIDVTRLDAQAARIGLPQGRLCIDLAQLGPGESFEIDIPPGAVSLLQPGSYAIDAGTADEPTRVAVFAGSAHVTGGAADLTVNSGDRAVLNRSNPVTARVERATPDAFVAWCREYGLGETRRAASRYMSPQMTGYADLDQYGGWQQSPEYGAVWYPNQIPTGWTPYSDGSWSWVPPWGWTWVDAEPWGFAPFHYGRWAWIGGGWGWVPGTYVANPVYAPALVAFLGGALLGAGPAVGWFPLAPGEVYWPSYTRNVYYIRNINVANVRHIDTVVIHGNGAPPPQTANLHFANRRFATVVPERVFAGGDPVRPAAMRPSAAALAKAPVELRPPHVTPTASARAAVRGPPPHPPLAVGTNRPSPAAGRPGPPMHAAAPAGASPAAAAPSHRGGALPPNRAAVGRPGPVPPGRVEKPAAPAHAVEAAPVHPVSRPPSHPEARPAANLHREAPPRPAPAPVPHPAPTVAARPPASRPAPVPHPPPAAATRPAPPPRSAPAPHPAAAAHAAPAPHPSAPARKETNEKEKHG